MNESDAGAAPWRDEPVREARLRELVEQFAEALRRGESPDPFDWVLAHADLAAALEPRLLQVQELHAQARQPAPTDSLPAGAAAADLPRRIGRYRIDGVLGHGGQAIVFRAFDPKFGRPVALKVLHPNLATAPGYLQRFHQTAKAVAKLRHPNIVELHDAGQEAAFHYLDTFLVEGETLQKRLERQGGEVLPYRASAELVYKLAQALQHAHEHGVVHRDIKPANILLPGSANGLGDPQLTDFGLARDLDLEATQSQAGTIVGAPAYMAPEQAEGRSHAADARSDVYGLGAVLYELLTGKWPFHECATFAALVERKLHAEPTPPRQLNASAPRDLEIICLKALERDPRQRFASAQALAEELWRWLHDEPLTIRPPTRYERLRRWGRRNRAAAILTGMLVAVVVAAAAVLGWMRVERVIEAQVKGRLFEKLELLNAWADLQKPAQGRRARALAKVHEIIATRRADRRPLVDAAVRTLYAAALAAPDVKDLKAVSFDNDPFLLLRASLHPDGQEMVIGTAAGPIRWEYTHELRLTDEARAVKPLPRLRHSPDGKYLAYAPAAGGLSLRSSAQVERPLQTAPDAGVVLGLGFERDGGALWTVSAGGQVARWSAPDLKQEKTWTIPATTAKFTAAAVSDDGGAVAIGDADGRALLFQSDGAGRAEVAALGIEVEAIAWSPDGRHVAIGTRDGTVRLADRAGGVVRTLNLLANGVGNVLFSPNGQWLIAGQRNAATRIWDTLTGAQVLDAPIVPWDFAKDGTRFAGTSVGGVAFGAIEPPIGAYYLRGHQVSIEQLTWSRDGRRLASLDSRGEIRVWDFLRETCLDDFRAEAGSFFGSNSGLALSDDGGLVAYARGGRPSAALVRSVGEKRTFGPWPLPAGFDRLACPGGDTFVSVREELDETRPGRAWTALRELSAKGLGPPRVLRPHHDGERGFHDSRLTADGGRYFWLGPRVPARAIRAEVYDVAKGNLVFKKELPYDQPPHSVGGRLSAGGRFLSLPKELGDPHWTVYDLTGDEPPRLSLEPTDTSPDGRWRLAVRDDPLRGGRAHSLKPAEADETWLLLSGAPVFSPDSRYVALPQPGGTIVMLDLHTLKERLDEFERLLTTR